jgi:hypothetical protein
MWRYLEQAAATPNSLHVVYINTSLVTKVSSASQWLQPVASLMIFFPFRVYGLGFRV